MRHNLTDRRNFCKQQLIIPLICVKALYETNTQITSWQETGNINIYFQFLIWHKKLQSEHIYKHTKHINTPLRSLFLSVKTKFNLFQKTWNTSHIKSLCMGSKLEIRAVTGQHSSPESCFNNKIRMFLSAKNTKGNTTGLQWNIIRQNHRTKKYRSLWPTIIITPIIASQWLIISNIMFIYETLFKI